MSLKINIIKGEFKGQVGKVIGWYMNGKADVKIGHQYVTLKASFIQYVD